MIFCRISHCQLINFRNFIILLSKFLFCYLFAKDLHDSIKLRNSIGSKIDLMTEYMSP